MCIPALLAAVIVLGAGPGAPAPSARVEPEAPAWNSQELKSLFARIDVAGRSQTIEEQDTELANIGGFAYRVVRLGGESNDAYARRALKKRNPLHPNVKNGQWLSAVMRQFYDDASKRSEALARFERDRHDRAFFERRAVEARAAADRLAVGLETVVEGMEGFMAPLPIAEGDDPEKVGAVAAVKNGVITIENLDRVRFVNDAPPADVVRTARGAIREIFAAQKQYNVSSTMLGMYESEWRRNKGNLRVVIPAAAPAVYLNELVLGGLEAEMHTVRIATMTGRGDLGELRVSLAGGAAQKARDSARRGKRVGRKPKASAEPTPGSAFVEVRCPGEISMQKCVDRIADARARGRILYRVE